jgi:hypothetical protein
VAPTLRTDKYGVSIAMTSSVIMLLLGESINIDSLNVHIKVRVAHKVQINNEFFKAKIEILFSFVEELAGENNDKEYLLTLASSFWSYSM